MEKTGDCVLPTDRLLQTSAPDNNGALACFKRKDFFSILAEHTRHGHQSSNPRQNFCSSSSGKTGFLEETSDLLTMQHVSDVMPTNSVPQSKIYHSNHLNVIETL